MIDKEKWTEITELVVRSKDRVKEIEKQSTDWEDTNLVSHPDIPFPRVMANFRLGATLNLGNYETLRIDIGATVPADEDKFPEAYEKAVILVTNRLKAFLE